MAEYIDYYNNGRIQVKTKWMPPVGRSFDTLLMFVALAVALFEMFSDIIYI